MRLGCVRGARLFFHLFLFLKCDGTLLPPLLHPEQALDDLPARGVGVLFCSFFFFFFFFLRCQRMIFCQIYIFCPVCGGSAYIARCGGRAAMQQADTC